MKKHLSIIFILTSLSFSSLFAGSLWPTYMRSNISYQQNFNLLRYDKKEVKGSIDTFSAMVKMLGEMYWNDYKIGLHMNFSIGKPFKQNTSFSQNSNSLLRNIPNCDKALSMSIGIGISAIFFENDNIGIYGCIGPNIYLTSIGPRENELTYGGHGAFYGLGFDLFPKHKWRFSFGLEGTINVDSLMVISSKKDNSENIYSDLTREFSFNPYIGITIGRRYTAKKESKKEPKNIKNPDRL